MKPALHFLSPLHRATRQIGLYLEGRMARIGVSNPEGHLLAYLLSYEPSPVGDLRRIFGLKGSTLTSRLDRLEKSDLIARHLDPEDRRSFLVGLTDRGREKAGEIRREIEVLEALIGEGIEESELAGFNSVIAAIAEATNIRVK